MIAILNEVNSMTYFQDMSTSNSTAGNSIKLVSSLISR